MTQHACWLPIAIVAATATSAVPMHASAQGTPVPPVTPDSATPTAGRHRAIIGYIDGVPLFGDSLVVDSSAPAARVGSRVLRCPMPILADREAHGSMAIVVPDPTYVDRMPVSRQACVNPLEVAVKPRP